MKDNIIELNRLPPTPQGILSRLQRSEDEIEDLVCVIAWKSGLTDIAHSEVKLGELLIASRILENYVDSEVMRGTGND